MLKYFLVSVSALAIGTTAALAADIEPEYEPTFDWSGVYIGVHGGYGWGDSEVERPGPPGPPGFELDSDIDGFLGGAQLGFNFQADSVLFGIVADFSLTDIDGDASTFGPPGTFETDVDWIATLRGRLGFLPDDRVLVYAHGGVALADLSLEETGGAGPWAGEDDSNTQVGFVIGGGGEVKVTEDVSLFAEYSYMDFGSESFSPAGPPGDISYDAQIHVIKGGVNFTF